MTEWNYLSSEPFQQRCILAADWLKGAKNVLEIGGYRTPIGKWLAKETECWVVDPRLERNAFSPFRKQLVDLWQNVFEEIPQVEGFVCLGLEIHAAETWWPRFIDYINNCQSVVLGVATDHIHSTEQHSRIEKGLTNLEERFHIALDLAGNDFGDLTNSGPPYTNRKLYFYRKK